MKLYSEEDVLKLQDMANKVADMWRVRFDERNAEWQKASAKLDAINGGVS